jgi:hypothetical protein
MEAREQEAKREAERAAREAQEKQRLEAEAAAARAREETEAREEEAKRDAGGAETIARFEGLVAEQVFLISSMHAAAYYIPRTCMCARVVCVGERVGGWPPRRARISIHCR